MSVLIYSDDARVYCNYCDIVYIARIVTTRLNSTLAYLSRKLHFRWSGSIGISIPRFHINILYNWRVSIATIDLYM